MSIQNFNIIFYAILIFGLSQPSTFSDPVGNTSKKKQVYVLGPGVVKKSPECELIDPIKVYERLQTINDANYTCDTYNLEYYEYIVTDSNGSVEIGMGFEDNFDGTWYGYLFEYDLDAEDALPSAIYHDDLTPEQVNKCREAFEPPFICEGS